MEIKPGRMVHLGYQKYWRSEEIVGLLPIEEDRGPGRRTEVYVTNRSEPVVAARTEETILEDLLREAGEGPDSARLRETVHEMLDALRDLSPLLKRMLRNEEGFDVKAWIGRLSSLVEEEGGPSAQEDLFPDS